MSIDLDWSKLDPSFASSFIDAFNRQIQNVPRPSFIGPIEVASFDFGSQPPDIELIDLRDIYRDFLDDDDDDDDCEDEAGGNNNDLDLDPEERGAAVRSMASASVPLARREDQDRDQDRDLDLDLDRDRYRDEEGDDEFEWVSRKSARRGLTVEDAAPMYYHHLPPHIRYARGPASDVFTLAPHPPHPPSPHSPAHFGPASAVAATVTAGENIWNNVNGPPTSVVADTEEGGARPPPPLPPRAHFEHETTRFSSSSAFASVAPSWSSLPDTRQTHSSSLGSTRPPAAPYVSSSPSPFSPHQDLSDPAMNPPLPPQTAKGIAQDEPPPPPPDEHPNLQLHLFVSWHSDLRLTLTTSLRINYPSPLFMSLPIKLSVTGLVFNGEVAVAYEGGRRVHLCVLDDLDPYGPSARRSALSQGSTPSDPDGDDTLEAKPLPVGQRLLPEIFIESELGQADKHVLKNVTRVEKFIQDVIRKTIEEELVFPNFHTLVLK
jgi:mitochondrial distribution and morphology protein 12